MSGEIARVSDLSLRRRHFIVFQVFAGVRSQCVILRKLLFIVGANRPICRIDGPLHLPMSPKHSTLP